MAVYQTLVGTQRLNREEVRRRRAIAKRHGGVFVEAMLPDGYRHWFEKDNEGEPFDGRFTAAVERDLAEAGR